MYMYTYTRNIMAPVLLGHSFAFRHPAADATTSRLPARLRRYATASSGVLPLAAVAGELDASCPPAPWICRSMGDYAPLGQRSSLASITTRRDKIREYNVPKLLCCRGTAWRLLTRF